MTERTETKGSHEEKREAARLALSKSGFSVTARELFGGLPGATVQNVVWNEHGRCSLEEGVSRRPNLAGILIKIGKTQYPEIRDGKLIGVRTTFYGATVEAHPDGKIEVKGSRPVKNFGNNWRDKETQKKALAHALEYPFRTSILRPATDGEKRDSIPYSPLVGETIEETAQTMASKASIAHKTVVAAFNDIGLLAWPGLDAKFIADSYRKEINRHSEEFQKSPQGQRFQRESKNKREKIEKERKDAKRKRFHIGDVLSVTTGHLVSPSHMKGIYDILNYMTGDSLFTHQLPRASDECKPNLLEQYPQLAKIDASSVNETNWKKWLKQQEKKYGKSFLIKRLPPELHRFIDPISEAEAIVGSDKVIPIRV